MNQRRRDSEISYTILDFIKRNKNGVTLNEILKYNNDERETNAAMYRLLSRNLIVKRDNRYYENK